MKYRCRFIFLPIFLIISLLISFQCSTSFASPKIVSIGITQEPKTLNPLANTMTSGYELIALINRNLTVWDENWNLIPELAEQLPSLKNGQLIFLKNGTMKVIWKLKKNLKWSDGEELTSDDFIFAHNLILDKKIPAPARDYDEMILEMKAIDKESFFVVWKNKFPYFNSWGVHPVIPKHFFLKKMNEDKETFYKTFASMNFPSCGPFILDEWINGVRLSFTKNPLFYGKTPNLDKIIYKIIPNSSSLEANLVSGVIDAISVQDLSYDQAESISKKYGDKIEMHSKGGLIFEHIDFNLNDKRLKDLRLRKAMIHAIDREKIVKTFFAGAQNVSHTWLHPKHYGFNGAVSKYPYDVALSKKLLKEAGYTMGESGFLVDKALKPLRFTLMSTSGNRLREQIEVIIQSYLKAVGIELEIENKPPALFFSEMLQKRSYPHLALYAIKSNPNTDGVILWTKDKIPSKNTNWEGQNYSGFINDESDGLLLKVPQTFDLEKRRDLLLKEQLVWTRELPSIPLFYRNDVCLCKKYFKGFEPTGNITPPSWNSEFWDLSN